MLLTGFMSSFSKSRPGKGRCLGRRGRIVSFEFLEPRCLLSAEGDLFSLSEVVDSSDLSGSLSAAIDWGDGTTSAGNVSAAGNGQLTARVDYSMDSNGFFGTQPKRDVFESAIDSIMNRLGDDLAAIVPGGSNTWNARFRNPATGVLTSVTDLSIAANEILIYAGGRNLGTSLGRGERGGYSASGSQSFVDTVEARGEGIVSGSNANEFGPWGGAITFNTSTNWHFGVTTVGLDSTESDFYSVAVHELGHLLGIGTTDSWKRLVSGGQFTGPASVAEYDGSGNVPLAGDESHWSEGTTEGGQEAAMDPTIMSGTRKPFTELDLAALSDIGWQLTSTVTTVSENHTYADNGTYSGLITLSGQSGSPATKSFQVTIDNVDPTLTATGEQAASAGVSLSITDIGTFTDPGFDNGSGTPPTNESFNYTIDWGDNSVAETGAATIDTTGGQGVATVGSFDGQHTYAVAGQYTVTINVEDDDGGSDTETFLVNVSAPPSLEVIIGATSVSENAGLAATMGTVSRVNSNNAGSLIVTLVSDDASEATVPFAVAIPDGQASVTFDINAVDDSKLDGDQTVTVTASSNGFVDGAAAVIVTDHETLTVTIDLTSIAENAGVWAATGTVTRSNTDNGSALTVKLTSSDTTEASVPAIVRIAAGEASATFSIDAVDDSVLDGERTVTISASAGGYVSVTSDLTVTDHEMISLTIDVDSVAENSGSGAATGTITRSDTDTGLALVVTLTSSDETEATVPLSLTIPANASSASFVIDAIDDDLLDGAQTVTIFASAGISLSSNDTLNVTDHETLTVTLSRRTVLETEGNNAATGMVSRGNSDSSAPLTITLISDDDGEATVPATITIPGGEASKAFSVDAINDGIEDQIQTVAIVASTVGYQSGTATLNVADANTITRQNPNDPFDVDNSGHVSPLDVLILIGDINFNGARQLPEPLPPDLPPPFLDVNGDGSITPLDILETISVINHRGVGEGEGASSGGIPMAVSLGLGVQEADPAATRSTYLPAPHIGADEAATELSDVCTRPAHESSRDTIRRLVKINDRPLQSEETAGNDEWDVQVDLIAERSATMRQLFLKRS